MLHDVFGYPFGDISAIMGRSETAVRQLASRARRKVQGAQEPVAAHAARLKAAVLSRPHRCPAVGMLQLCSRSSLPTR